MAADATTPGPHQAITATSAQERFAARIFDTLWDRYRERVSYVGKYEEVIAAHHAKFVNDHIAFRTIASQSPQAGIASVSRVFEALGYRAAGSYQFPDKHLNAIHFQPPNPQFPKLFVSELKTWELSDETQAAIANVVQSHRSAISLAVLAKLYDMEEVPEEEHAALLQTVVAHFHDLPWSLVDKSALEAVNKESQYAAWVLVHGYNVNHFTAQINSQGVTALDDIEKVIAALTKAGVPMKTEIEGERGSKLRQTATEAVTIEVNVLDNGQPTTMPWTYAYFELAQRDPVLDPVTNKYTRFEGFLGAQATNLFEMTRVK